MEEGALIQIVIDYKGKRYEGVPQSVSYHNDESIKQSIEKFVNGESKCLSIEVSNVDYKTKEYDYNFVYFGPEQRSDMIITFREKINYKK